MNFLIYNYIFYSMSKNTLITPTYLFICFEKKIFNHDESNRIINTLFIGIYDFLFI